MFQLRDNSLRKSKPNSFTSMAGLLRGTAARKLCWGDATSWSAVIVPCWLYLSRLKSRWKKPKFINLSIEYGLNISVTHTVAAHTHTHTQIMCWHHCGTGIRSLHLLLLLLRLGCVVFFAASSKSWFWHLHCVYWLKLTKSLLLKPDLNYSFACQEAPSQHLRCISMQPVTPVLILSGWLLSQNTQSSFVVNCALLCFFYNFLKKNLLKKRLSSTLRLPWWCHRWSRHEWQDLSSSSGPSADVAPENHVHTDESLR